MKRERERERVGEGLYSLDYILDGCGILRGACNAGFRPVAASYLSLFLLLSLSRSFVLSQ